ncbi:hypothetical protein MTO96_044180, partial [Rhipicephalus appendiculatus]
LVKFSLCLKEHDCCYASRRLGHSGDVCATSEDILSRKCGANNPDRIHACLPTWDAGPETLNRAPERHRRRPGVVPDLGPGRGTTLDGVATLGALRTGSSPEAISGRGLGAASD